jgi:hypothetical protein
MLKAESELRSLSAIDSGVAVVVGVNHIALHSSCAIAGGDIPRLVHMAAVRPLVKQDTIVPRLPSNCRAKTRAQHGFNAVASKRGL